MIPNLPTDSLYKFGFVGGIFLIFFSYYTLLVKMENYTELSNKLDIEQATLQIGFNSLIESQKTLNFMMENDKQGQQLEYVISRSDELERAYEGLKSKEQEIKKRNESFKVITDQITSLRYLTYVLVLIGFIFTFISGYKWYYKIQKYQDLLLKIEYETRAKII